MKQDVPVEFAPTQLAQKLLAVASRLWAQLRPAQPIPDLKRADLTEPQMGREPGCGVERRPITAILVLFEPSSDEVLKALVSAVLSWVPGRANAAGPVGVPRLQLPFVEFV